MKIDINKNLVPVSSLEYGDCFVCNGIVCMRCLVDGQVVNIQLSNGQKLLDRDDRGQVKDGLVKPIKLKAIIDANP